MSRPLLSARPLLDTDADAALFVPLGSSLVDLVAACDRGYSTLIHGPRGSGRTTLLRALQRHRRQNASGVTVYVQASAVTGPLDALHACRAALLDALDTQDALDEPTETQPSTARGVADELALLAGLLASGRTTFLVDNLDPHIAHRLFGTGRDDLWELDASFVVTVADDDLPIVLAPPADAFFEVRIGLPRPTRTESEEILRRRLGRDVDLEGVEATPRALVEAARTDPDDPASAASARRRRLDAAARLGTPALGVAQALEEFGTVSPSDAKVRDRLGLTAARVSQILVQMYDDGLVTYDDVRDGGPGRPKRRYRWVVGGLDDTRIAGSSQGPAEGDLGDPTGSREAP